MNHPALHIQGMFLRPCNMLLDGIHFENLVVMSHPVAKAPMYGAYHHKVLEHATWYQRTNGIERKKSCSGAASYQQ